MQTKEPPLQEVFYQGRFRGWLKSLGLPLTFAELGAKEEDIPLLVKTLNLNGNTLD